MSSSIKPYLDLCRVSNLPTVWTNVLAAVILSGADYSWADYSILALSLSLFYSGGMCLNDICDTDTDRAAKPFRPLPSGRISLPAASVFTFILFAAALALVFLFPGTGAVYGGIALAVLITGYNVFHKSHPSSVLLMAACRSMVFVASALAVSGTVGALVAVAGSLQFIYVLAVSVAARGEKRRGQPFGFPLVPSMIAGIALLDGIVLGIFASAGWVAVGIGGAALTHFGQRYIRGD